MAKLKITLHMDPDMIKEALGFGPIKIIIFLIPAGRVIRNIRTDD